MRKFDAPLFCSGWARSGDQLYAICGGGGGDGNSGVRNVLVAAQFDPETGELSDAVELLTDRDYARNMAMHPITNELVCAMPANKSHKGKLKLFKLSNGSSVQIEEIERETEVMQSIGEQRSLSFSIDGKLLATGGESGELRVFRWPEMEVLLDRRDAHKSIKDVDFSPDAAFLMATDEHGASRVWSLSDLSPLATLPVTMAGFCRFSRDEARPCLYVTSAEGRKGIITVWNFEWKKIMSKKVIDEPISAFNISSDGKLLAVSSTEGHVSILRSAKLSVLRRVRDCHMVFGTDLSFSHDNKWLLSVSADSSARVLACEPGHRGWRLSITLLMILAAFVLISVYNRLGLGSRPSSDSHDLF